MNAQLLEETVLDTVNVVKIDKSNLTTTIMGSFENNSAGGNIFAQELLIKLAQINTEYPIEEIDIESVLEDESFETNEIKLDILYTDY